MDQNPRNLLSYSTPVPRNGKALKSLWWGLALNGLIIAGVGLEILLHPGPQSAFEGTSAIVGFFAQIFLLATAFPLSADARRELAVAQDSGIAMSGRWMAVVGGWLAFLPVIGLALALIIGFVSAMSGGFLSGM